MQIVTVVQTFIRTHADLVLRAEVLQLVCPLEKLYGLRKRKIQYEFAAVKDLKSCIQNWR